METQTQTAVLNGNYELTKIVHESGLQLTEAEEIKQSYLPYFEQLAAIKEDSKKINFETPGELDEKIARELRLRTVKVRTGSESVKEDRKKMHTLKANVEQSSWNLIKSTCQLDEERFMQVEKKREIAEKARAEMLRVERMGLLSNVTDAGLYNAVVGQMTQDAFDLLLSGFVLAKKEKEEKEKQLAIEAIEKENAAIRERAKQAEENKRLKAEAEANAKIIAEQKAKADAELKKVEALRKLEQEKSDALLEAQRKQAADKLAKEKAISDSKLQKEREANDKLKAELQAKEDVERKAETAKQAELKAKEIADAMALKAPDKEKLNKWIDSLMIGITPNVGGDAHKVAINIQDKFSSFKKWANTEIENL